MLTDLHSVGVQGSLEGVHPDFVQEKLLWAREKSWELLNLIGEELKEGMTEKEAFRHCMSLAETKKVAKHWHKPWVRFGPGTLLTFHEPLQETYQLKKNDPIAIDIGPVWEESGLFYEGDVGKTFVFGENTPATSCIEACEKIFNEAKEQWKNHSLSGEQIYAWMKSRADELGYQLHDQVNGHRLSDFPHQKYSRENLARLDFCPTGSLWVLEVHLSDPANQVGAFYEDIL